MIMCLNKFSECQCKIEADLAPLQLQSKQSKTCKKFKYLKNFAKRMRRTALLNNQDALSAVKILWTRQLCYLVVTCSTRSASVNGFINIINVQFADMNCQLMMLNMKLRNLEKLVTVHKAVKDSPMKQFMLETKTINKIILNSEEV